MSQQNTEQTDAPSVTGHPHGTKRSVNYDQRPMLVFWETTRACQLACKHCRASATPGALPGELSHDEGIAFIDSIAGFGRPHPILVLTGGDCLLRPDIFELVDHATSLGIPTALSPSVTPMLTPEAIQRIVDSGVKAVSISLDGATAATHEGVRGIPGHFPATVAAIRALKEAGLTVQINTTVMSANLHEMPDVAALLGAMGVDIWEVFFLVHVGRGVAEGALTPAEHEDVCHLLYDASQHGFIVRTVEAPFFRRIVASRRAGGATPDTDLYRELSATMHELMGAGTHKPSAHTAATRDGKGIVFVAHDGDVYPAGFLPLKLGNVRETPLADIYRDHPDLKAIRAAEFTGQCGVCTFADMCGGSRARAWAASGDVLAEDPACQLVAEATSAIPVVGGVR
jgi:radical SAM protein